MKLWLSVGIILMFLFFNRAVGASESNLPNKIIIPTINISLPVELAKIKNGTWEVYYQVVSYGEDTSLPGEIGNTVIFSHAFPTLFGNLNRVKRGNFVFVLTQNKWFSYKVISTKSIEPNDLSIIFPTNDKILTLYTCDGIGDKKRFAVKAKLFEISNLHQI